MKIKNLLCLALSALPAVLSAQQWAPKQAALMTTYAKQVNPAKVLAEYPRPQMTRANWLNLNGLWQFEPGSVDQAYPQGKLARTILVPFPVESALSGVMEHHERLWYRRQFTLPASWKGKRLLLHFGAVDYQAEIFINGKSEGIHQGGYDPFTFDITEALKNSGPQELTVRVYDPTDKAGFPRGKQTLKPQGIMYTSVTGIWQTVWLEPVPETSIADIKMVPDIDRSILKLTVHMTGASNHTLVQVKVKDRGRVVSEQWIKPGIATAIPITKVKLWSPDQPFLYQLAIALKRQGKNVDQVSSYFGMRKIAVENEGNYKKLYLNNKFLFELGPLDQGFWPDGGYTAPTDEALKSDLVMIKKLGFNMVRKHIKVEPFRWYYWADKLGLLVWQDMPSPNSYTAQAPPVDTTEFRSELGRLVQTHINSPCIVTWDIFNEAQGQQNTASLVNMVHRMDPSRLINQASGGEYFDTGDYLDIHSYPAPAVAESKKQVLACGEYGGIGFVVPGHIWGVQPTYIMMDNEKKYLDLYDKFARDLCVYKTNNGLSAAVYTEITDVEAELNGLITYDRKMVKGNIAKLYASNYRTIHDHLYLKDILPSAKDKGRDWKYTFDKPTASWNRSDFSDAGWRSGPAGFGSAGTQFGRARTKWDSGDIWLRQEFTLAELSGIDKNNLVLMLDHDDDCEVYINGIQAAAATGFTTGYTMVYLSAAAKNALHLRGKNVIAIHCHQISGGQFIDAGIALTTTKP